MAISRLLSPRDAAKILGISYPTLKQWIYKKKLRTVKTAGGHHRIPESELDKFLHLQSANRPFKPGDPIFVISADGTSLPDASLKSKLTD